MQAELVLAVSKALSVIKASGLPDFGSYPRSDEALAEFVKVYAIALCGDSNITPKIVEITAVRYIRGEVQTTTDSGMAPVSRFPSAADFLRECKRTWSSCYRTVIVGEYKDEQGRIMSRTINVPAAMPQAEVDRQIAKEQKALGVRA